jgi:renal tumor antigen
MYSEHPYTEYISTRWYRAPECLLTDGYYDYKVIIFFFIYIFCYNIFNIFYLIFFFLIQMDVWGVGCVMFEIIALFPLFPGKNELD